MKNLMKPENGAEANVIRQILKENGIEAEIRSFHDTAYDGIYQAQYGWGVIRVPDRDYDEARRIVSEWYNAVPDELPWESENSEDTSAG